MNSKDEHAFGGEGEKYLFWQGARIGTCGEPADRLRVSIGRTRAIPDIILSFDGKRNGWMICGSFRNKNGNDFEYREVAFIDEDALSEDIQPSASMTEYQLGQLEQASAALEAYIRDNGAGANDELRKLLNAFHAAFDSWKNYWATKHENI